MVVFTQEKLGGGLYSTLKWLKLTKNCIVMLNRFVCVCVCVCVHVDLKAKVLIAVIFFLLVFFFFVLC